MARKTTISREGLEFLIGAVKNTINIGDIINNEDLADNKTYSNIKIEERIDDKIDEKLADFAGGKDLTDYQEKTDNTLTTTDKTIVGAINEVKDSIITNMDKVALKHESFNKRVTLTDSNWKYETITFEKNYNNTPSVNVSCGDYLNVMFYSYWGCEAYIVNINNKGCIIRYRSSKASESEPLEVGIITFVNGI